MDNIKRFLKENWVTIRRVVIFTACIVLVWSALVLNTWQDGVNSVFENSFIIINILNILELYKKKKVRGFNPIGMLFFNLWSFYNLYYYNNLDQIFSLIGTFLSKLAGVVFIFMTFYYIHIEKRNKKENKKFIFKWSFVLMVSYVLLSVLVFYIGNEWLKNDGPWPDRINGFFEFGAAFFAVLHPLRLLKQKKFGGATLFWPIMATSWGAWNLYYYPHLDQWWSFYAGISIFSVNLWWSYLIIYFSIKQTLLNRKEMNGYLLRLISKTKII